MWIVLQLLNCLLPDLGANLSMFNILVLYNRLSKTTLIFDVAFLLPVSI